MSVRIRKEAQALLRSRLTRKASMASASAGGSPGDMRVFLYSDHMEAGNG